MYVYEQMQITHSHGSNMFYYFMLWVESDVGGRGGSDWVSRHIEAFVNVGGPMLGNRSQDLPMCAARF